MNYELDYEKEAFILAWSASIWKRIWRCIFLYCDHQNVPISSNIMLKCLKYNLLCPTGIVSQLLPYLEKAFRQGFLMPKEYEGNEYVKRAIRLFGEAYKIVQTQEVNLKEKQNFIKDYCSTLCIDKEEDRKKEEADIISFPNYKCNNDDNKNNKNNKHECSFCELVDAWDIDLSLYVPSSDLHALIFKSLFNTLI